MLEIIQNPANNVLYAISKHHFLGVVGMLEGVANLMLSVWLIGSLGILGVAIGTAVPLILLRLLVIPLYVCRRVNLASREYYQSLAVSLLFSASYLALVYVWARDFVSVPEYGRLLVAAIAALPLYLVGVAFLIFTSAERVTLRSALPQRLVYGV